MRRQEEERSPHLLSGEKCSRSPKNGNEEIEDLDRKCTANNDQDLEVGIEIVVVPTLETT